MDDGTFTVGIAGNPNVGKSVIFNALTGSRQHVGNWPGKTVERAEGHFTHGGRQIHLVDGQRIARLVVERRNDDRAGVDPCAAHLVGSGDAGLDAPGDGGRHEGGSEPVQPAVAGDDPTQRRGDLGDVHDVLLGSGTGGGSRSPSGYRDGASS